MGLLSPSTLGLYSTDLFAAAAAGTIASHAASHGVGADSTPLFLYAAFEAAHGAASCFREGQSPDCETPDDDELQVPARYIELQAAALSVERREYGGMVSALDAAVGAIADALSANGMYSRSLLLFCSDNGAPHRHLGGRAMSNYPLRGGKAELWEGGVRSAAFVAGGALPPSAVGRRSLALLHATDWLPTLLRLAGASPTGAPLYGVDATRLLSDPDSVGRYELRQELLLNHDSVTGKAALRVGQFKLVRNEAASGWGGRLGGGRGEEESTAAVGGSRLDQGLRLGLGLTLVGRDLLRRLGPRRPLRPFLLGRGGGWALAAGDGGSRNGWRAVCPLARCPPRHRPLALPPPPPRAGGTAVFVQRHPTVRVDRSGVGGGCGG